MIKLIRQLDKIEKMFADTFLSTLQAMDSKLEIQQNDKLVTINADEQTLTVKTKSYTFKQPLSKHNISAIVTNLFTHRNVDHETQKAYIKHIKNRL